MTDAIPPMPSLDAVRAELDFLVAEQERRGVAFDSRAGFVLGFSGVLIGLTARDPSLFQVIAQVAAAGAAGFAGYSMWPRVAGSLGPRRLRERYLTVQLERTKLALLDTRIKIYELDEERLAIKVFRLKLATSALGASVLLLLIGSIVEFFR